MIDHIQITNQTRIVEITHDAARIAVTSAQNAQEWRGMLTVDQHVAREHALDAILAEEGMPVRRWTMERLSSQGWEIVSSMETLDRPAYVKVKGERPTELHNYVLDAVFTPEAHRGNGYARELVKQVCSHLAEEAGPEGLLFSLWSDVGAYYERCGFRRSSRGAMQIVAPADPAAAWPKPEDKCIPLNAEDSRASVDYVRATMISVLDIMTERDGQTRTIVAPTTGILRQMQWRTGFVCNLLGLTPPKIYGAKTPNGAAAWMYNMDDCAVYILAIAGPILEMVTLFQAAQAAAKEYGFRVVLYEADLLFVDQPVTSLLLDSLLRSGVDVVYEARSKSLPYYMGSGKHADMQLEFAGRYSWY